MNIENAATEPIFTNRLHIRQARVVIVATGALSRTRTQIVIEPGRYSSELSKQKKNARHLNWNKNNENDNVDRERERNRVSV